jgi:hypothetical protein
MVLKFIFCYFFFFWWLPSLVVPRKKEEGMLDRFFISLIHTHVFLILLVHILVGFKLFETFSLLFLCLFTFVLLFWQQLRRGQHSAFAEFSLSLMDYVDLEGTWKRTVRQGMVQTKFLLHRFGNRVWTQLRKDSARWFTLLLLLFVSFLIRFQHSLTHLYFAASDPYVHLKWAKALGENQLYVDGIYPYGFEAVIAGLQKFFSLDPYYIVRFLGPLAGGLATLSIYYYLSRKVRNSWIPIVGTGAYLVSSLSLAFLFRQMSSLSMEYGLLFLLPGIYFLSQWITTKEREAGWLAAECLLITTMIHPYTAFFQGLAYLVVFLPCLNQLRYSKEVVKLAGLLGGAVLVGVSPILVALAMGKRFHGASLQYVETSIQPTSQVQFSLLLDSLRHDGFLLVFVFILLFFGVYRVFHWIQKRSVGERTSLDALWIFSLLLFFFYEAKNLGLPSLMDAYRVEVFFTLIASTFIGMSLLMWRQRHRQKQMAVVLLILLVLASCREWTLPKADRYQYDEAVAAYLDISTQFQIKDWTIVSPIEEYSLTLDKGWHYNLWQFVQALSGASATSDKLTFPTDHLFLFVEKIPLGSSQPIRQEDGLKPYPQVKDVLEYYTNSDNRRILEAKAWSWAEQYRKTHPDLRIYRDTPNMRIYQLEQDRRNPVDLLSQSGTGVKQ